MSAAKSLDFRTLETLLPLQGLRAGPCAKRQPPEEMLEAKRRLEEEKRKAATPRDGPFWALRLRSAWRRTGAFKLSWFSYAKHTQNIQHLVSPKLCPHLSKMSKNYTTTTPTERKLHQQITWSSVCVCVCVCVWCSFILDKLGRNLGETEFRNFRVMFA